MSRKRKPHRPHWYLIRIRECVYCLGTTVERERRYTPKPDDPSQRYDYDQFMHSDHLL